MKKNVNEGEFIQRFVLINRKENFTYDGRKALFDYFTDLEDDTGEEIDFDPISICCEYTEYNNIQEFRQERENYKGTDEDYDGEYTDIEKIRDHTIVIMVSEESFIIQQY